MNIVGKEVTHVKYGLGTILEINENKMQVDFESDTKTFIYPESFEKFFSIEDKSAKKYIDGKLIEINRLKSIEQEEKEKEEKFRMFKSKFKVKVNSQAVFEMNHSDWQSFLDTWSISTGIHLSGNSKGKPRIPKNLNMNSACLLTMKPEGGAEKDRIILGVFMTPNEFIGENCITGIVPAHEKYRIMWESEHEELLFWDYFSDDAKLNKWGSSNMKYISITLVKKILEDMISSASEISEKEIILDFYQYFCQMNHL